MAIKWKQFATTDFWFGIDRVSIHMADRIVLFIGIALVSLGIAFFVLRFINRNPYMRKVSSQFATIFFVIGFAELIWFGLRTQYVATLGTHFIAALIGLIGLIWAYFPTKYLLGGYQTDIREAQRQQMKEKYLQR